VAVLLARFCDQVFAPFVGSVAETVYGRLGKLHLDGPNRLDPRDRSYFYGYTIRLLALWPGSFTPLLLAQAVAGGITAVVFAVICSRLLCLSSRLSYLFGLLCALDPCQLVWERYVMTEAFSLLFYVLVLYASLLYLRDRRIWQLAVVQVISVVLIGFRMSYLPVVQACTILLPVIAFGWPALRALRNRLDARLSRFAPLTTGCAHVLASVVIMFVTHNVYKQVNGWLSKREPAYLYGTGFHLVSVWAPLLQPDDATDPRFRELIAEGYKFNLNDPRFRDAQQFSEGFLVHRWTQIERNRRKRDRIAMQTAMTVLRQRPLQIAGLAMKTYMGYWQIQAIQQYPRIDLGNNDLTEEEVERLAKKFRFRTVKQITSQPLSLLQVYFVSGWPYYFVVLLAPLTLCVGDLAWPPSVIWAALVYPCLNLNGGDYSSVLAAINPLSSTIIYADAFQYRDLLGSSREERNRAGTSRLLISVSVTRFDGFVVHFFAFTISPERGVFT